MLKLNKFLRISIVFLVIFAWIFSGWPKIWQASLIPPEIKSADAASVGPNSPTSADGSSQAGGGTITWTNPTYATSSDNYRATAALAKGVISYYLQVTGFNFNIPTNARIDGIVVEVERSIAETTTYTKDNSIKIIQGGAISGNEYADTATDWPINSGDAYATYGGSSDLWGLSWTAADINSSNFGVAVQAKNTKVNAAFKNTAQVDHIRITVYYILPTMTVGTTGSQTATMNIPSTNNYVGGAFTFVTDINTATTTQIIITDTGTVNANLNLSNVDLYYETAATCSYEGTETLFGTATSFNASEKATVTGTMTVGTSQICVYVRLDVGSGAGDGQTMEIRIADPSTEVTVSAGTVSPATPVDIAGTTTLGVPAITVGTTGTQTGTMIIPSQDNNVGGAFTFVRNTGTANVTQIVISDLDGTVNANLNLSDVVVFYKQEVSCSASIPGDATQWNTAGVGFDASENATVIGDSAMVVGTSQICVYVRLDVGSGVGGGETLEIEITDPSTEVTVSAGVVKPATAVAIAGTTTFQAPTYISYGIPFFYDSINWGTDGSGVTFYYEVYMRATAGTVYARLYDETVGAGVADSVLSTADASFTRLKTIGLTMTNGNTYRAQFGKIGADAGETLGGKLVVNQDSVHKENTTRIALAKPESTKTSLVYSDSSEPIKVNLAHSAGMLASVSASSPPPQKSFFSKIIDKFMELTSRTIIIDNTQ